MSHLKIEQKKNNWGKIKYVYKIIYLKIIFMIYKKKKQITYKPKQNNLR